MRISGLTVLMGVLALGLLLLRLSPTHADPIGGIISYQGKLTNPDRTPVADGIYKVVFKIYENVGVVSTTVALQELNVATLNGVFAAFLSTGVVTFDPNKNYELGVTLNGVETKFPIASVPVAQVAKTAITANMANTATIASTVSDSAITATKIAPGAVNDSHIAGVSAAKITSQLQGSQIANGTITDSHITSLAASKISGGISTSQIADGAVTSVKVASQTWTDWHPVFYKTDQAPLQSFTVRTARYIKIGTLVWFQFHTTGISDPVGSTIWFDLPVPGKSNSQVATNIGSGYMFNGSAVSTGYVAINTGDSTLGYCHISGDPNWNTAGNEIQVNGFYEATS